MSQAGMISVAGGGGSTTFVENVGSAAPAAGIINVLGGPGISTSGSGNTITITATGGAFTWNDVTSGTQLLAVENGYVTDFGAGVTYTLPATAVFGSMIAIVGKTGMWTVAQNANQQILSGSSSSTVGVGGSIASTSAGDCVELICITGGASTVWRARNEVGNLTI